MGNRGDLSAVFLGHLGARGGPRDLDDLETQLRARVDAARAAWPELPFDRDAFVEHMAARSAEKLVPLERAADLFLACACARGEEEAISAFHGAHRGVVARAVARIDPSPAFVDDVVQAMAVKLFVDVPPAIVEYGGRASLQGWVATVAKRTALNLRRKKDDQAHQDVSSGIKALGAEPEMALLKARYKAEFEAAIREGLAAIPAKDRTLLLLHLVSGVTLPKLAAMQGVSRATVARWLASAREALLAATQSALTLRLKLSPSEYESVLALVRSQLDVSLSSAVAKAPGDEP